MESEGTNRCAVRIVGRDSKLSQSKYTTREDLKLSVVGVLAPLGSDQSCLCLWAPVNDPQSPVFTTEFDLNTFEFYNDEVYGIRSVRDWSRIGSGDWIDFDNPTLDRFLSREGTLYAYGHHHEDTCLTKVILLDPLALHHHSRWVCFSKNHVFYLSDTSSLQQVSLQGKRCVEDLGQVLAFDSDDRLLGIIHQKRDYFMTICETTDLGRRMTRKLEVNISKCNLQTMKLYKDKIYISTRSLNFSEKEADTIVGNCADITCFVFDSNLKLERSVVFTSAPSLPSQIKVTPELDKFLTEHKLESYIPGTKDICLRGPDGKIPTPEDPLEEAVRPVAMRTLNRRKRSTDVFCTMQCFQYANSDLTVVLICSRFFDVHILVDDGEVLRHSDSIRLFHAEKSLAKGYSVHILPDRQSIVGFGLHGQQHRIRLDLV